MWSKILFTDEKRQFLNHRRALLSKGKSEEYEKVCAKMGEADEKNLQEVIDQVLKKINVKEQVF